jgi:hypothetical protein
MRKLETPCKLCKGKSKQACLICGWKAPKEQKKKKRDMTFMELSKEIGEQNRKEWLIQTHNQLSKYGMDSTGVLSVDSMVQEEVGPWKPEKVFFYLFAKSGEEWKMVFKSEKLKDVELIQKTIKDVTVINTTGKSPNLTVINTTGESPDVDSGTDS